MRVKVLVPPSKQLVLELPDEPTRRELEAGIRDAEPSLTHKYLRLIHKGTSLPSHASAVLSLRDNDVIHCVAKDGPWSDTHVVPAPSQAALLAPPSLPTQTTTRGVSSGARRRQGRRRERGRRRRRGGAASAASASGGEDAIDAIDAYEAETLGFQALESYGFSQDQIDQVRDRFLASRGHLPPQQLRQEEIQWMNAIALISLQDPGVNPVDVLEQNMGGGPSQNVAPGGFPLGAASMAAAARNLGTGQRLDMNLDNAATMTTSILTAVSGPGSHFDFILGTVVGFTLGPIVLVWMCEDSLTAQFRMGLIMGLLSNISFGILRYIMP